MAGKKQPLELVLAKGKKHLTKKEIEERKKKEVKAKSDKVKAPKYLPSDLKREFKKISDELVEIGIMSNLDVDALARFLMVQKKYLNIELTLLEMSPTETLQEVTEDGEIKTIEVINENYEKLLTMQDKLFKQARSASSDLGLTISSRCKLVVPKAKEDDKPLSKEERLFGGKL
ncbi:phage terminase, small subunit, putative, P27 family [Mesobacillus persicus]|uniref:Phage terminase, small subunit, putative, P27 family n=1 Tax=Mesobacillus persicus TaxID=930146 RepID=A0A1H7XN45_9BACI|nr:phage terminase small subunit P27 family [Mesobacillus persicus]SEM35105.1 phage terminase, small subunit, putative, P27 family [Mesobacillus persicus]